MRERPSRNKANGAPKVVSLFAGAGGLEVVQRRHEAAIRPAAGVEGVGVRGGADAARVRHRLHAQPRQPGLPERAEEDVGDEQRLMRPEDMVGPKR